MRDGTELAYALRDNRETSRRVVLIHSLGMDQHFWHPAAERLAADASLLLYDCRGHGRSDKPNGPYSVELFARDLAGLLDHVGWDAAMVAGASMGGCVTLAFAAAYPQRATAIGLIDTTAWYGPDAPKQWAERAERARTGLANLIEFQKTRWFSDRFQAAHPEIVQRCVDTLLANDVRAYGEICRMLGACDLRGALPELTMPAAVIVGEEDYATPLAMAETLQRGIPGATLTVLDGVRHLTPLEDPERVAAELRRLLARERAT